MEKGQELVIDASVALKWFVKEAFSHEAHDMLAWSADQVLPIVPALFFYEITNILRYKPEFGIIDIQECLSALSGFGFLIVPLDNNFSDLTIELAFQFGITIYDASYIAISRIRNCDFVTADEMLFGKLTGERIIHLKDWKAPRRSL